MEHPHFEKSISNYGKVFWLANPFLSPLIFPPSSPSQTGPNDLRHFDPEFTDEPVPSSIGCSPDSMLVTASIKEASEAFVGFSYAPSMDSYL